MRFNVVLNLAGQVAPLFAALFVLPELVKELGPDRLGILTISWVLIGYFGLFDLGIGRALTRFVSMALSAEGPAHARGIALTGLSLMTGLGFVAGAVMAMVTPVMTRSVLGVPPGLYDEAERAFYFLAIGIPFTIIASGLTAVLEAHQRFVTVNLVRIPTGFLFFVAPYVVVSFTKSLSMIILSVVLCRMLAFLSLLIASSALIDRPVPGRIVDRQNARELLSFGGWLTVSNIVGPLMLYADRFFVASMVSLSAVAYYTVPFEAISRILIIPSAILGVMFPAFARSQVESNRQARSIYIRAQQYVAFLVGPVVLMVLTFAGLGLALWINDDYAQNSALVARILAVGVLVNSIGLVAQALVQARGRPDLTAKLHLIEAPLYFTYLTWLIKSYGVSGAATAWLVRVGLSAIILTYLARQSYQPVDPV
jgi:O-antigen/teichoic acid export membrane protein